MISEWMVVVKISTPDRQGTDPVALLRRLLVLASHEPTREHGDSVIFLNRLLELAPRFPARKRKLTLFESIDVLNLENPHSDFIAWLLDDSGPLTDCWLLRALLARVAAEGEWSGAPIVEREVATALGRADIVVKWDTFKLIIENKVWSLEGADQVGRYLRAFEIRSPRDGRLIFLSPHGKWPRSVPLGDERVVALNYLELANLVDAGLSSGLESTDRGRIFAQEYRDSVKRLLRVSDMQKPKISEATRVLLGNAKLFEGIKTHAIEE